MNTRIKQVRNALNMSQIDFGQKIAISGPAVAKIENGKNNPSDQTFKLICLVFGISYSWLKDGIGKMYREPDSDDELVDNIMFGDNEFAKDIMKRFAKLSDDHWAMLREMIEVLKKGQP